MISYEDIEQKIKRKNKILLTKESECLQPLLALMNQQTHRTMILWALDNAQIPLAKLAMSYPQEERAKQTLSLCYEWAQGHIKMPIAKKAILACHRVAKEIDNPVNQALFHAIGHAGATVHVASHAIGLPMYELTAMILENSNWKEIIQQKIDSYYESLIYWQDHESKIEMDWALFL